MKIYLSYYFPERTNKVQFGIFGSFYFFFHFRFIPAIVQNEKNIKEIA